MSHRACALALRGHVTSFINVDVVHECCVSFSLFYSM